MTGMLKRGAIGGVLVTASAMSSRALLLSAPTPTQWQFEKVADGPMLGCVVGMTLAGFDHDPQGRPVMAWREENNCGGDVRVVWTRKEGDAWVPHEFVADHVAAAAHQFILRPSDGNPFLLYRARGPNGEIATFRSDLGAFDPGVVSSDYLEWLVGPQHGAGVAYSLAFAPGENLPQWATGLFEANDLGPVRLDGMDVDPGHVSYRPRVALAVTPDGVRHLLWNSENNLFSTRWTPGDTPMTNPAPIFGNINRFGGEVTLASDATGVLHAVIRGVAGDQSDGDQGAIVYITSTDGGFTWTPFEYVNPDYDAVNTNGVHTDISLALDSHGVPAVTYWRSKQELWYARRDGAGGSWTHSLVTVMPFTGNPYSAQIRFDAASDPVIAYYNRAANQLQLARPVPSGVTPPIDIAVTGTVSPNVSRPGDPLTYTLTVTNKGVTNVDHVVLSNQLPAGVTLVNANPLPDADGRWSIGLLTSGASITIAVFATAPTAPGDAVDLASVISDGPDVIPANNKAAIGVTIRPPECFDPATPPGLPQCGGTVTHGLDIAASVIGAPNPAAANGMITYVLRARNVGTVDATGVTLDNTLPPGVSLIDATPAPMSVSGFDQFFKIGTLPAGVSAWVVLHALAPSTVGTIVDKANVSITGDVNAANDTASTLVDVKPDACFVTPTNLVSRWRGDGSAYDDVGGHDGQVHGAGGFVFGRVDKAFRVDGSDGFVTVPDGPGLRPKELTLSAWVRPDSLRPIGFDVVAAKGASIILAFNRGVPYVYTGGTLTQAPAPAMQPGQWYLLTGTYDGGTARMYVNGAKVAESFIGTPVSYDDSPIAIGALWLNGQVDRSDIFDGLIDEVTLHSRALTDTEVRGLYDGSSPSCPPPNRAPALLGPGDQLSAENQLISVPLTAIDPDGDAVTFSATGLPAGLAIDQSTRSIAGLIAHKAAGVYPVTLTAGDGALSSSVSLTWTVLHTPCSPFAQNDSAVTAGGTAIDIPALDNDIVPAACIAFGAPNVSAVAQPQHGSTTFDAKLRTVTYTPVAGFDGIDTFTYTIANSAGDTATATVTVTVAGINHPPTTFPLGDPTNHEGDTPTYHVEAFDTDRDPIVFTVTGLPPGITMAQVPNSGGGIEADARFTGVFAPGSRGTYHITLTIDDGHTPLVRTFTWTVLAPNHPPTARPDSVTLSAPISAVIHVLDNDDDADGDPLTLVSVTQPAHGAASLSPDTRSIQYSPFQFGAGYSEDTFSYTVRDPFGATATATVTVRMLSPTPRLAVSIVANPPGWPMPPGTSEPIAFTITVANLSVVAVPGVLLVNTLPSGTHLLDATPAPQAGAGPQNTFALGTIAGGASASVLIHATVPTGLLTFIDSAYAAGFGNPAIDPGDASHPATVSIFAGPGPCFVPLDGPIARWHADGSPADDVSHLFTQLLGVSSTPGHEPFAAGRVGQAFQFVRSSSAGEQKLSIQVADDPKLRPDQFTISAWAKPSALTSGGFDPVVAKSTGLIGAYTYRLGFSDGRPSLQTAHAGQVTAMAVAPAGVSPGDWYHLTGSFDGTRLRLYVNGVLVADAAMTAPLLYQPGTPVLIGDDAIAPFGPGTTAGFAGLIDEVSFYGRALGDAEVRATVTGSPETCFPATVPDLEVTLTASPAPVQVQGLVTLTATVTNHGPGYVNGITLTNDLPIDATFTVVDTTPAVSSTIDNRQTFPLNMLLSGQSQTIVIRAAPRVDGHFVDHMTVPGVNPVHSTASVMVTVEPEACFIRSTQGLVSRWRGDGALTDAAVDDIGHRNGTLSGNYQLGRVGQAFLGTVTIPDDPALRPAQFAFGAWVRPTVLKSGGWDTVVARGASGTDPMMPAGVFSYFLGFHDGFPVLETYHVGVGVEVTQSQSRVESEAWYYLAGSYDGTTARLYVNGALAAQTVVTSPLYYDVGAVPTTFGGIPPVAFAADTFGLWGLVDEVLLYDRALTDGQMRSLFDGSPRTCVVNDPPVFVSPKDQTNKIDDKVSLQLQATDTNPASTLHFSAVGLPNGLAIDDAGLISGQITSNGTGPHVVTVTVSDGQLSSTGTFAWTVLTRLTVQVGAVGTVTFAEGNAVPLLTGLTCGGSGTPAVCTADFVPGAVVSLATAGGQVWWSVDGAYTPSTGTDAGQTRLTLAMNVSKVVRMVPIRSFTVAVTGGPARISDLLEESPLPMLDQYIPAGANPGFMTCDDDLGYCAGAAPVGTAIVLHPKTSSQFLFSGWSGGCSGSGNCGFTMTDQMGVSELVATANFVRQTTTLTLDVGPGGRVQLTQNLPVCDGGTTGTTCVLEVWRNVNIFLSPSVPDGWPARWKWTDYDPAHPFSLDSSATVFMDGPKRMTVTFKVPITLTLTGRRTSWPFLSVVVQATPDLTGVMQCGFAEVSSGCTGFLPWGTTLSMTPLTSESLTFLGWAGACGGTGTCTVTLNQLRLTVEGAFNSRPAAFGDSFSTFEDGPHTLSLNALDNDNDPLTPTIVTSPAHGTLVHQSGLTYVYTPALNFNGTDSFIFTVSDGHSTSDQRTVQITVSPINDPPVLANPGHQATILGQPVTLALQATDVDDTVLRFSATGLPAGLSIDTGTGVISGTPTNVNVTSPVVATVSDFLTPVSVSFTWTVVPPNTPTGAGVTVDAAGPLPGKSPVSVTFAGVSQSGETTYTIPITPFSAPDGFRFGTPGAMFDIETTAHYTKPVTVCINYGTQVYQDPASLHIFHFEGNAWVDRTLSVNTTTHVVCASVNSLSPFALAEPIALPGRMHGEGEIDDANREHRFDFDVSERPIGRERGSIRYSVRTPGTRKKKDTIDTFESTSIESVTFWDDPRFKPGHRPTPATDSVVFTGFGCWNGTGGYTFEVRAADEGEPGRRRDTFTITVRDAHGVTVASVNGVLDEGNIQSERVNKR